MEKGQLGGYCIETVRLKGKIYKAISFRMEHEEDLTGLLMG
jgi:hypothetical protein